MNKNRIEIWQPRYKDNTVLLAKYKIVDGENEIIFTKAKHLADMVFSINSNDIKQCSIANNGKIDCYVVPMDKLTRIV